MKKKKTKKEGWISFLILSLCSIAAIIPFIWIIFGSFKNTMEIFSSFKLLPDTWRFSNYPNAWTRAKMGTRFFNSLFVTLGTTGIGLVFASLSGYSFAKLKLKKHPWLFYLYLGGMAIPIQAIFLSIFLQLKMLNLDNSKMGLVLGLIGTGTSFATYLMRNFFRDISDTYSESAQIDGSSVFNTFIKIYLPLARPGLLALAIFMIIHAWNEFDLSLMVLIDDKNWTIPLAVSTFKSMAVNNYGLVFSSAVLSFAPTLVLYSIFQRSFIEGITVGGVKG